MKTFQVFIPLLLTFIEVLGESEKICAKEGTSKSAIMKIKNKILCNYDKEYRPIKNQKDPVIINLRMVPRYLSSISDNDGTMDIHNWLGVTWTDEFLTWNPSDYESVRIVHLTNKEIWTPDLKVHKDGVFDDMQMFDGAACTVSNNGFVNCVIENDHELHCTTDVLRWPYDSRTCELKYTTGVHNSSEVQINKFRNDSLVLTALQPNTEWELTNSTARLFSNNKFYQIYPVVTYTFHVKRHSSRTTSIVIIPALSLIILTLVPLWMHPENTNRFSLLGANIISHFLFIQHVEWAAPTLGTKIPPAITFFRDSLGLAIVALIELTLIKWLLAGRTASPTWLFAPCKLVASSVVGKTLLMEDVQEIQDEETITQNDNKESKIKQIQGDRCLIVAVIDRILFFVLSIVYFVLVMLLIPFN